MSSVDRDRIIERVTPLVANDTSFDVLPGHSLSRSEPVVSSSQLVFVGGSIEDHQSLVAAVSDHQVDGAVGPVTVVVLSADRDGVRQITEVLAQHHDLAAIHIFSHGAAGSLQLGSVRLDAVSLAARYQADLAAWGYDRDSLWAPLAEAGEGKAPKQTLNKYTMQRRVMMALRKGVHATEGGENAVRRLRYYCDVILRDRL